MAYEGIDPLGRPEDAPDLRYYLDVLRRRKWSILGATAATLAAALAVSFRMTPIYEASARVQVSPPTANELLQAVRPGDLISMDTERAIAGSQSVARLVAEELPGSPSPRALLDGLDVSVPQDTQILEFTYADPDPLVAARTADAFAEGYLRYKTKQTAEKRAKTAAGIQAQIDEQQKRLDKAQRDLARLKPGSPRHSEAQARFQSVAGQLTFLRNQLGNLSVLEINPGEVIEAAEVPTSPARPNHVRNGVLAFVVGLLLGVGLAFLRDRLDTRIGTREELEEAAGAPVLAVVPQVPDWKRRSDTRLVTLAAPRSTSAEAYRTIRTNVEFIAREDNFKVLIVTSAGDGEGKTTTVANLAVTLAQTGKRVVAVSTDLRKPRLHRFYELGNEVGVTSVLAGQASLVQAAQRCRVDSLRVVPSGPTPPNPAELLASSEMEELLAQLRRAADYVILDTPPVLAVADTLILAPKSDGVVLVADASRTSRAAVQHAREQLAQVGGNVIGAVFNNFDPSRAKYYSSYYRYYYSYRYTPDGEARALPTGTAEPVTDPEMIWR